jgi:hypothetical protein
MFQPYMRFVYKFRIFKIENITISSSISLQPLSRDGQSENLVLTTFQSRRPTGYCGAQDPNDERPHYSFPCSPSDS